LSKNSSTVGFSSCSDGRLTVRTHHVLRRRGHALLRASNVAEARGSACEALRRRESIETSKAYLSRTTTDHSNAASNAPTGGQPCTKLRAALLHARLPSISPEGLSPRHPHTSNAVYNHSEYRNNFTRLDHIRLLSRRPFRSSGLHVFPSLDLPHRISESLHSPWNLGWCQRTARECHFYAVSPFAS